MFDSDESDVLVNWGILANMVVLLILLILVNLGILTNLVILVQHINMVNLTIVFTLGILLSGDFGGIWQFWRVCRFLQIL